MGHPKFGLIHYNFPGYTMDQFLSYAEETGFEYVEIQIGDIGEDPRKAEQLRRMLDDHGLKVSALAAGNDFVQLDPIKVREQVDRMRRICDLAEILGTDVIRTEGGSPKDSVPEEMWVEAISNCLSQCLDFVESKSIYLALDNHGLVTNDADRQVEIFRRVNSKYVGANLDTMNYRWFGHDLETVGRFYEKIAPYTLHTHMKDGKGSRENYVCLPLGDGELDLERAIRSLKDSGYHGVWCVEYEGRDDPAVGYRKGLEYLRRHV